MRGVVIVGPWSIFMSSVTDGRKSETIIYLFACLLCYKVPTVILQLRRRVSICRDKLFVSYTGQHSLKTSESFNNGMYLSIYL